MNRRLRRLIPVLALAAVFGLAASSSANAAALTLTLTGTHPLGSQRVVLASERVVTRGFVGEESAPGAGGGSSPAGAAPPGTEVHVMFRRGARVLRAVIARTDAEGNYNATFRPPAPGQIVVEAKLAAGGAAARSRVTVLPAAAQPGDRGPHVAFLQQQLRALHYAVPATGQMDLQTQRAVLAFRKVNDMPRVMNATPAIFLMAAHGAGGYRARFAGHGRHVEADLTRQVLALVNPGGRVASVYITSSGRPSLPSPVGSFRVFRQHLGWRAGQLDGSYYVRSRGFTCGIHGYPYIPTYPASHCCLRVPIPNARHIRLWIQMGTQVDVFYRR